MIDDGDKGLKILYDLLVKAAEFPGGESPLTCSTFKMAYPAGISSWDHVAVLLASAYPEV